MKSRECFDDNHNINRMDAWKDSCIGQAGYTGRSIGSKIQNLCI